MNHVLLTLALLLLGTATTGAPKTLHYINDLTNTLPRDADLAPENSAAEGRQAWHAARRIATRAARAARWRSWWRPSLRS